MGNPNFTVNAGKVKRLYSHAGGLYFYIAGQTAMIEDKDGYYLLKKEHENYTSIFSLLLAAAQHGWSVNVCCEPHLWNRFAIVDYVLVDF